MTLSYNYPAAPIFLTHRNYEIIIVCGLKPLTLGLIYYAAIGVISHIFAFYPGAPQILMTWFGPSVHIDQEVNTLDDDL